MFKCNVFNDKIQKTKVPHLWNGSRLTSQTAHFFWHVRHFIFVNFHENLIKTWWKLYFPFQILAELCFCTLTVMLKNLSYLSRSCKKWSSSRLKLETVHFLFVLWKTNFPNFFSLKAVFSTFSCLNLILNDKISETKDSHLWNDSQLTSKTGHFRPHFISVWWKSYFHFKILVKLSLFNLFPIKTICFLFV